MAVRGLGDSFDPDGQKASVVIRYIFDVFGNRLERLHLMFASDSAFLQILGPSTTLNLPDLVHLHVHVNEKSVEPNHAMFPSRAFSKSKKIESISLRNCWWNKDLCLPQLLVFDVYNPEWAISPQQLLHVISNCPKLQQMPVEFEYKASQLQAAFQKVILPSLVELQTTCEWVSRAGPTLAAVLELPALSKLQLYGSGDIEILAAFIRDVTPKVESLHLGLNPKPNEPEIDILPLLEAAKEITELELDSVSSQKVIFETVARSTFVQGFPTITSGNDITSNAVGVIEHHGRISASCIIPKLGSLVLKNPLPEDTDALLELVQSRTKRFMTSETIPRKMHTVTILGESGISGWHEQEIDDLLEGRHLV